jgi:hypothetical protein
MKTDIDFLIPLYIDHEDRTRNCNIVLKYLNKCGFENIYIAESFKDFSKFKFDYNINFNVKHYTFKQTDKFFNKMISVNKLFRISQSPIIALYDADTIILKGDIEDAIELIEQNKADIVYPYNGQFYNIPPKITQKLYQDIKTPFNIIDCKLFNPGSHGGAVIFSRDIFKQGGMCNEKFKNVGYDDDEIFHRFEILGYSIQRTQSPLFHLDHFRGNTSFNYNDYIEHNKRVLYETVSKNKEDLKQYIKTWKWVC